jgi:GNAT superfamily N-acetyltransferase
MTHPTVERADNRYQIRVDCELAGFTEFRDRDAQRVFIHTEITEAFQGRGLSSELIERAVLNATSRFHDPMHAAEWAPRRSARTPRASSRSSSTASVHGDRRRVPVSARTGRSPSTRLRAPGRTRRRCGAIGRSGPAPRY